ncbi:3-oxoacyl-[acyl-carrier protein] reductase [Devosia limi DSM 17137]|uniref:3-oxoacyl-[acyl-carrier protein] reductase n=1 Tax=Devosia limi DSM 17137 TaxID=1121477 RepID=A0A1M5D268_9HYPH|nr:3-oxoacyl-[acyl-carrier protein] reductase [Devosia limi DSM 17137]
MGGFQLTKSNIYDLGGRRVVIAGGGGQIGQAIALRMQEHGAAVEVWDLTFPGPCSGTARRVDVTDAAAVGAAMDAAVAAMGGVDALVYAVGATGPTKLTQQYTADEWKRLIDINLNGAFNCIQSALECFDAEAPSHIVTIASIAGKEGNPRMAAYSAAKAGLIALTKSVGRELAHTRTRTHAIAPALIDTNLLKQMKPEIVAQNMAKIPMGRAGTPGEVAELAAWLISPGCTFTTGAVHDLSGGRATY